MYGFVDMHCDTISCIRKQKKKGIEENIRCREGHIDLERMKKAGYMMQTFAAFVNLQSGEDPTETCMELIDEFYTQMEQNRDLIRPAKTAAQVRKNYEEGFMSGLLSIEEGGVCKGNPALLRDFYRLGVRMMTLTWNYENELAWPNLVEDSDGRWQGSPNTGKGVKERGLEFLSEMERLGIIIDVSHLSDAGFYDVWSHTTRPFIASHSNSRSVCGHVRNLTDDMLRKLADRGGVAGLNMCALFTDGSADGKSSFGTLEGVIRHAEHMRQVGGIGCIGLGTDFDGIEDSLELNGCDKMPLLTDGLKKHGFHESELDAIFHGNVLRVMDEVLSDRCSV